MKNSCFRKGVQFSSTRDLKYIRSLYPKNGLKCDPSSLRDFVPTSVIICLGRIAFLAYCGILVIQHFFDVSLTMGSTLFPLLFCFVSSMIICSINFFHHMSQTNFIDRRKAKVLRNGQWNLVSWENIYVGDIIQFQNGDVAPADCILLTTSNKTACAISSHAIDGSTRLKARAPLKSISDSLISKPNDSFPLDFEMTADYVRDTPKVLSDLLENNDDHSKKNISFSPSDKLLFSAHFYSSFWKVSPPQNQQPNISNPQNQQYNQNNSNQQSNQDNSQEKVISINQAQYIERYSSIFHVGEVVAAVVYTGKDVYSYSDTSYFLSYSELEKKLNTLILIQFIPYAIFSAISAVLSLIYYKFVNKWPFLLETNRKRYVCQVFIRYLVLLLNMLPIEIYPAIDIILLIHLLYLQHEEGCKIQSIPFIEDLTNISSLVTSKGSLISQKVQVKKIFIDNTIFSSETLTSAEEAHNLSISSHSFSSSIFENSILIQNSDFQSQNYYQNQVPRVLGFSNISNMPSKHDFFLHLCLCHCAMPIHQGTYHGYMSNVSEDEPLLKLAKDFGYWLISRDIYMRVVVNPINLTNTNDMNNIINNQNTNMNANLPPINLLFRVFRVINPTEEHPFLTTVIYSQHDEKLTFYLRGDEKMLKFVKDIPPHVQYIISDFMNNGLNPLCYAYKKYSRADPIFNLITSKIKKISEIREPQKLMKKLSKFLNKFVIECTFLGIVGLEEEPNAGVVKFFQNCHSGKIQIILWSSQSSTSLITTAFSTGALLSAKRLLVIDSDDENNVKDLLKPLLQSNDSSNSGNDSPPQAISITSVTSYTNYSYDDYNALAITGRSIDVILNLPPEYINPLLRLSPILISKATSEQVSQFIGLLQRNFNGRVLGIGSSLQDNTIFKKCGITVSMDLNSVNPISLCSNIIITKFESLNKFIFVTGMWLRERLLSFISYIIPRNLIYAFCQFIYGFFSCFSGTSLWNETQICTTLFISTMFPAIARAFLNKKQSESELLSHPELYSQRPKGFAHNTIFSIFFSFFLSLFLITLSRVGLNNVRDPYGDSYSLPQFSYCVNTLFVFGSFAMLVPQIQTWSKYQHLITWGTLILSLIISAITNGENEGQWSNVNTLWNSLPLFALTVYVIVICLFIYTSYYLITEKKPDSKTIEISQNELTSDLFSTNRLSQVENGDDFLNIN